VYIKNKIMRKTIFAIVVAVVVVFITACFILWSVYPGLWSWDQRLMLVIAILFVFFVVRGVISGN